MASSPATSSETIVTSDSIHLLNINMTNVTKLTDSNFLMWSRQVHALLDGYDLTSYIDGSIVAPPPTNTTDGAVTVNPEYKQWKRQDELIYSALLGAISVTVQPLLSTTMTSAQIWETLSSIYAIPSRGHIRQLRQQIKQWVKGTKSIREYFQGFTTRFDQLALLGEPFKLEDQIDFILAGLSDDYKQVIDQIEGREVAPSLTEIHEKLLNHEVILQVMAANASHLPISANVANYRGSNNNNYNSRGQNRSNSRSNQT